MKIISKYWKEISLVLGLVILYRQSFTSPFFQDDKILFEVAKTHSLFEPIANFPYRPIAIQLFYSLSHNQVVLHDLEFLIFMFGLYFIYKLTKDLFVTAFVAFNISLFPLFYWVATSYFSLAFFFTFSALYANNIIVSVTLFILGLLSNELVVVFPALYFLFGWLTTKVNIQRTCVYLAVSLIYLPLRFFLIPFPTAGDYTLNLTKFFATFRWYVLRLLNLPEGIRGPEYLIYGLFITLLFLIVINLKQFNIKHLAFAAVWFLTGALPFFFLPNHMSAYYLTLALFGPAVFLSKILNAKTKIMFIIVYVMLSYFGLEYLKVTHWIILK